MITVDLEGKIALVTGSSRGIGAEIARTLASAGARVAVHYNRSRDQAEAVASGIRRSGGPPTVTVHGDLEEETARRGLMSEVLSKLGPPAILVNNAAIYEGNPFEEPDDAAWLARWRRTMNVNLEAAAHLTLLALPGMRRAGFGRIVMVSSRAAFRAETDHPDYAVSKAGMVNLVRCLARNEGGHGITANAVCPGWVETAMARDAMEERRAEITREIPAGRVATTRDVAEAVLFFVSPLGSYANGTALPLNGGSYLH